MINDKKLIAEQNERLQGRSAHIKKIIELTGGFKSTENIVEIPVLPELEAKIGMFTRVKNYFIRLFYKYVIEPEIKKIKIERELSINEKTLKILAEGKKKIYATLKYENDRYFERMGRARNENNASRVVNASPLFYNPDIVNIHNEDINRELKPSLIDVIQMETSASLKVLKNQSNPKLFKNKAKLIRITSIEL